MSVLVLFFNYAMSKECFFNKCCQEVKTRTAVYSVRPLRFLLQILLFHLNFLFFFQSHFISALTVVFVNSKSLSSLKIDDTPVDDPSLKVLVANNSDTLKLLKMSSCPHVSPAGKLLWFWG